MAATGILSIPFRLDTDGSVATTAYGSDAEVTEAIAALTLTVVGERPMSPEFGIPDPAFGGISTGDVQVGLDQFGPQGITVTSVEAEALDDTTNRSIINWQRKETEPNA